MPSPTVSPSPTASRAPVWMPDPGVPMIARALAYTLGTALLLAVWVTVAQTRPPDVPPPPTGWATTPFTDTLALPAPEGWAVSAQRHDAYAALTASLTPGSAVRIEAWAFPAPVAHMNDVWDALLGRFAGYTVSSPLTDIPAARVANQFTFRDSTLFGRVTHYRGAWAIRELEGYSLVMIGTAPQESWAATEPIFRAMVSGVVTTDGATASLPDAARQDAHLQ